MDTAANAFYRDYAAIVFFANNRFETGKKKLQYLTFQDFAFCAGQLINNWTVGAVGKRISIKLKLLFTHIFKNSAIVNDLLDFSLFEGFALWLLLVQTLKTIAVAVTFLFSFNVCSKTPW